MAMKIPFFGVLVLGTIVNHVFSDPEMDNHWEKFKVLHNKHYKEEEEVKRRQVFENSITKISKHNIEAYLGMHSFTLGLNEFSDIERDEFARTHNGYRSSAELTTNSNTFKTVTGMKLPDSVDWRTMNYVTPVGNQGSCGACWAFSACGSLEGQWKKKTGMLVELSKQNLIDCSWLQGNKGCNGGKVNYAFEYIKVNKGIDTEHSYPQRTDEKGRCRFSRSGVGATDTGFANIPPGDEEALKQAVALIGPISVAIDASQWSFQLYRNGIYNEKRCNSRKRDHAVLVVGYGTEGRNDYWLVKNSWGTSWGMQGYVKMARNQNNQCGIASEAIYPLV